MVAKTALIVDDSRVPLVALRKMLERYELCVDTAESGEEALDYLGHNLPPNVIFLDHMMPGMDGFETMAELRRGPATAKIPVVMYTSKDGEAYIDQARALGAVDVLVKPPNPAKLDDVLRGLGLVPIAQPYGTIAPVEEPIPKMPHRPAATDMPALDIVSKSDSHATLVSFVRQASSEQQNLRTELQTLRNEIGVERAHTARRHRRQHWTWAALTLAAIALVVGYALDEPTAPTVQHPPAVRLEPQKVDDPRELVRVRDQLARERLRSRQEAAGWLELVTWALNQHNQYDYDKAPFSDELVNRLRELGTRLALVGFKGVLRLETHVGEFCLVRNEGGRHRLPADDTPFDKCEVVAYSRDQAQALSERGSSNLAELQGHSPFGDHGFIRVAVVPLGNERPLVTYPAITSLSTAGEWNRAAQQNNRVAIALVPHAVD